MGRLVLKNPIVVLNTVLFDRVFLFNIVEKRNKNMERSHFRVSAQQRDLLAFRILLNRHLEWWERDAREF
jgi:hypothetical protein